KGELEMTFGCGDGAGMLADVHADVNPPDGSHPRRGHWWVLRIADRITPLVSAIGVSSTDRFEWEDENTVATLAELDLDHDGKLDAVMKTQSHYGNPRADYDLHVWLSASRKVVRIAQRSDALLSLPLGHAPGAPLVLGITSPGSDPEYKCV